VLAARRLGVPVAATAYVGDAARDVEAAQACGALAVAAAWGHEFRGEIRGALVLDDPSGLAGLV
jgi:phosphoglycolate phosphatase/AHBA synthesis associated protein